MSPVLRPADSPDGWGSIPSVGGNPATTIPDPVTGVSVTSTVQSNTAATQALSQKIVLPPPPGMVMNTLDPSGALLMWAQNLIRKMGGYTATPIEDSLLMEDTSETVDWASRQQIQELALFDIDREPVPQQMTEADLWPDDSTKAWVKAQKYLQAVVGYVPTTRNIATTSPLTGGGDLSADRTIAIPAATTSVSGYLTSTDWNTFNGKQAALGYTAANDSAVVHNTGAETGLAGAKTWTSLHTFSGGATGAFTYSGSVSSNGPDWSIQPYPFITGSGVMEIGKYIDFHGTSNDGVDFQNRVTSSATGVSFSGGFGVNGNVIAKPTITGSRGGNAALASLLTALANYGLITDSTTA